MVSLLPLPRRRRGDRAGGIQLVPHRSGGRRTPRLGSFWIVRRERLDALLIDKAIENGAELLSGFEVTDLQRDPQGQWQVCAADGRKQAARAVVIADGSGSPWPARFGLGPSGLHLASTTSVRLEGRGTLKQGSARFEFGLVHHGFAWAFPWAMA